MRAEWQKNGVLNKSVFLPKKIVSVYPAYGDNSQTLLACQLALTTEAAVHNSLW